MKTLATSLVLLVSLSFPALATRSEVESGVISTVVDPGTAYNPTGIQIGSYLYLYVQTIDPVCTTGDSNGPRQGDLIQAYRAPIDAGGTPGAFSFIGRISPCLPSTTDATAYASFGPGQIFPAKIGGVAGYHLLADESDQTHFNEIWHASTTDGVNWTWEVDSQPSCTFDPFNRNKTCADPKPTEGITTVRWKPVYSPFLSIDPRLGIGIVNPVMLSTSPTVDNAAWWGYLKYVAGSITTTGMQVAFDSGPPQVKLLTAISPSFTYTAISGNQITSTSQLYPLIPSANAKSLLYDAASGGYQLWGDYPATYNDDASDESSSVVNCRSGYTVDSVVTCGGSPTCSGGCKSEIQCVPFGTSKVAFDLNTAANHVGSAFFWWPVTSTSLGSAGFVGSLSRFLPSGYLTARTFPFRWNSSNGTRYLFSATNDNHICSEFLFSEFAKMYIVRSQVSPGS